MKAYSIDLRQKVVSAVDRGEPQSSVAKRYEISAKTVGRWIGRRDAGQLEADRGGPKGPIKLSEADDEVLRSALADEPGLTLGQLSEKLSVMVVKSTICRRFQISPR